VTLGPHSCQRLSTPLEANRGPVESVRIGVSRYQPNHAWLLSETGKVSQYTGANEVVELNGWGPSAVLSKKLPR
jgi:hypothetical protein